MKWIEDLAVGSITRGTNTTTLVLLNACLLACILVCATLLLCGPQLGLPTELLPHLVGLLLLVAVLAFSVNWLVTLTGVVSPEEQRRELFGDPQADRLTAAGSTSGAPLRGAPPSPPPVEQRLSPVPPSLAAAGAAAYAAGSAGEESEDSKDKDL